MSEYNKEDIKNLHYNNNNEIQYEYGGQIYHCSMEHLKEVLVTCWDLQQENQQLKEDNKELEFIVGLRQKRNLIRKFDEEYDEEDKKEKPDRKYGCVMPDAEEVYKRYYKQKEVIEEVREYINHEWFKRGQLGIIDKSFQEWQLKDILQILDKAKETIK